MLSTPNRLRRHRRNWPSSVPGKLIQSCAEYESIIREQNATIKKLQKERDNFSFSCKEITRQWMDVLEDVRKEYEKKEEKLKRVIAALLDMVASLKNRNVELDEKRKKMLHDYYETAARVNGSNNHVIVCRNNAATMYFARESKGHAAVKGIPTETFGGILIHDHEACFYSCGSDHQECMVHIERYLRDSIENEKNLTWNGRMLKLIQEMIHENNLATEKGVPEEKIAEFEARYYAIVQTAAKEYEDDPPSAYYREGYNLYLRIAKYRHNHLLFLSNPLVEPDNNLCERKARILKGKMNQAISLRSFKHLIYFCECLSILDHFTTENGETLYESVKGIFKRPRPVKPKSAKSECSNSISSECQAG